MHPQPANHLDPVNTFDVVVGGARIANAATAMHLASARRLFEVIDTLAADYWRRLAARITTEVELLARPDGHALSAPEARAA
jgi:hypothetical protein